MTKREPALLWRVMPADIRERLVHCLDTAASETVDDVDRIVFFRADDVGVPGPRFRRLVHLFRTYRVPLTLAVVPAWLTEPRWQRLREICGNDRVLWGWLQHGWRHLNHESQGKKQEFGPSRPLSDKQKDLHLGFQRLSRLMGEHLLPAFTPPWNRCDQETLGVLQNMGYKALSSSQGPKPAVTLAIPDYAVNVDLHCRKDKDAASGWQNLFEELRESLGRGFCGIMIHHQRMNEEAFAFLNILLPELKRWGHARLVHLGTLMEEGFESTL